MKHAEEDVQFFDAKMECADGVCLDYKMLNVTHSIKGIDHEKSTYSKMKLAEQIAGFQNVVYKKGCLSEHQLARDQEYKGHLLVSQALFDVFTLEKIAGVRLVTPEEFYNSVHGRRV